MKASNSSSMSGSIPSVSNCNSSGRKLNLRGKKKNQRIHTNSFLGSETFCEGQDCVCEADPRRKVLEKMLKQSILINSFPILAHFSLYKKEKSLKMKRDVGMACQKVHKQGRMKVMVNIQSLIHPYLSDGDETCVLMLSNYSVGASLTNVMTYSGASVTSSRSSSFR